MFKIRQNLIMAWTIEEHCLEINVMLIQYISFRLYSGTSIKQAWLITDTSVWRVLFVGTMKLMD